MTTIGEKTADYATFIDDLVGALTGFGNWSDADSYVQNDGTGKTDNEDGTEWHNNGRVLEDTNTGTYLLLYLHHSRFDNHDNDDVSGVRLVYSSDWNTSEHYPAGDTNIGNADANDLTNNVGFQLRDSYTDVVTQSYDRYNGSTYGIWGSSNSLNRDVLRGTSVSYIMSVNADGFNIGLWNDNDGNNGIACMTVFDYLGSRFFNDPSVPFLAATRTSFRCHSVAYGFNSYWSQSRTFDVDAVGHGSAPLEAADWGIINPSSEDDTFFFRYPAVYKNTNQSVPVAYLNEAVPNDAQEGGAHGDDFTHDGTSYKVFKQSGASRNNVVSAGLRNE
ncbi:hypothetical protein ACERIM_02145 [Natrinema sp. H-ect1]|uniref:hypothetical protein n=1 Tax=Natrinema sp. H-ect1 TaxID=3242700 RepID=UPI00359D59BB